MSVPVLLGLADVFALCIAFLLTEWWLGDGGGGSNLVSAAQESALFLVSLPAWIVLANVHGLYDRDRTRADHGTVDDIGRVVQLVAVGGWALVGVAAVSGLADPYPEKLVLFGLLAVLCIVLSRGGARAISRRQTARLQRVVIVGAGKAGQLVAEKILAHPEYGLDVVGFIDDEPRPLNQSVSHLPVSNGLTRLPAIVDSAQIDRVVVAFTTATPDTLLGVLGDLRSTRVQVDILPRLYDYLGYGTYIHTIEGLPLLGLPTTIDRDVRGRLKRLFDVVAASVGLVVLAPVLGYIALRLRLDSPGPIFYRHVRVGRHGRAFGLCKFRTMRADCCRGSAYGGEHAERVFEELMADPKARKEFDSNFKLHDDPRVTRYGATLRRRSLDELPQLLNVVCGDMSLVGPRPVTTDELDRYGQDRRALLTVQPGITGYWQINGRSEVNYNERVRLDRAYLDGWSFKTDLVILAKTVRVILARSGAF